jgi:asparagine synthase (glutamine-hydrolysing)
LEFLKCQTRNSRLASRHPIQAAKNSALRRILAFDQTSWLPDNLLERGDRMTMAASLEARMPFLDQELVAFVSSLPDRYRLRFGQSKWILRQAMKVLLPKSIIERPKIGFRVPVNEWFRGAMSGYLTDMLTGNAARCIELVDMRILKRILREHIEGRTNHEKLLWTLLGLEIWLRQYLAAGSSSARETDLASIGMAQLRA